MRRVAAVCVVRPELCGWVWVCLLCVPRLFLRCGIFALLCASLAMIVLRSYGHGP